ncbi:MAG TPA: hypothetical protein VGX02_05345 [Candidatus Eremiobacteraceae bacterium]|nr:hypothetical protein [Candidatus Eremiobacteraceae bacterium]
MKRINFLAIALGVLAAPLAVVLSAKADLAQLNDGAPLTVINSTGGRITVHPGESNGMVRVPNNAPGVQMSRFNVTQSMGTFCVPRPQEFFGQRPQTISGKPRGFRPPPPNPNPNPNANQNCRLTRLPLREGPHGVAINNPGTDLEVSVPSQMELMYIKANASPVLMERTRGPYIIIGQNDVALHGVAGQGYVQTAGNVDARNPAGVLTVATSVGRIVLQSGPALERVQLFSLQGDIEWTIAGVGGGPYRVNLGSGAARLYVRPGIGANIDATSIGGSVVNLLDPSVANVGFSGPHAVAMTVGGGGAQIIVHSQNGSITIAPAP